MSDTPNETVRGSWARATWAGVLSLALPGLGQIYARWWRLGVLLLVIGILPTACCVWLTRTTLPTPPHVAIGLCFVIATITFKIGAAADAVYRARRYPDPARPHWAKSSWFTALIVIALLSGFSVAIPFGWGCYSLPSASNLPTLAPGDYVIADKTGPGSLPLRGDVVLFKYPPDPSVTYIKRVIGLPGDRIWLRNGQLYLNGQIVPRQPAGELVSDDDGVRMTLRHYIESLPGGRSYSIVKAADQGFMNNTQEYLVPAEHFFVLGDNRDNSSDSRFANSVGYVPEQNLIGKAWIVIWSRDHARIFTRVD